jgi:NAD+ synthase
MINNRRVIDYIVNWLKQYVEGTNGKINSLVVGVSGGIDSAVTSTLCAMTGIKTILLKLPIKSSSMSLSVSHCKFLENKFNNIKNYEIDLTNVFNLFQSSCVDFGFDSEIGFANTKARIRMIMLYQVASSSNGLVVGTGNKVEDFGVGFFTKYGDGGVDISPIADLTKSEVKSIAQELKISKEIIMAEPTDGLWDDNRNDQEQLGLSYEEIEKAMLDIYCINRKKYLDIRKDNIHKMNAIPVCIIDEKIKSS